MDKWDGLGVYGNLVWHIYIIEENVWSENQKEWKRELSY